MNNISADYYIKYLDLQPHPEGGFYKETYRADEVIPAENLPKRFGNPPENRSYSTAIYYLLQQGDFSGFHRIKSDECWHFYAGQTLLIHVLEATSKYYVKKLGTDLAAGEVFQFVVPAGAWFASEPALTSDFALVGCTVAPGFDFADFEMAERENLLADFTQHSEIIARLCRL